MNSVCVLWWTGGLSRVSSCLSPTTAGFNASTPASGFKYSSLSKQGSNLSRVKLGENATSSVRPGDVELQSSCLHSPTPHKQLHIWAGWDAFGEQKGGWGPAAGCVNEWGPEGDPGRQAPVVLLADFQSRLNVFQCPASAFSGHLWQTADMLYITGGWLRVHSSFFSPCRSICCPVGLLGTLAGPFPCISLCLCMCVAEGHLISGLAARHACLQVVCPHMGAEQI